MGSLGEILLLDPLEKRHVLDSVMTITESMLVADWCAVLLINVFMTFIAPFSHCLAFNMVACIFYLFMYFHVGFF